MGDEIGNHSYTHLINPPTETFTATTVGDTPAGSTTITLNSVPSFGGSTMGMFVTDGSALGSNTPITTGLTDEGGTGDAVENTLVTAVNGDTISISYTPAGYGGANVGTLADIPAGTTLTFAIPPENTNFLQTTGTVLSADGNPFTYAYEFGTSKTTRGAGARHHDLWRRSSRRQRDGDNLAEHPGVLPVGCRDGDHARLRRLSHRRLDRHWFRRSECDRLHGSDRRGVALYRAEHDLRLHRSSV